MENKKNEIIQLFFIQHLAVKDIAKMVNTTPAYITKVVKTDTRYIQEKQYRKDKSKEKRKLAQNQFMKDKREKKKIEDNYSIVQAQHTQATRELSKSSNLSNENYRKWNSSAYRYNPLKKRFEFNERLGRSFDVPKYIKERR